MAAKEPVKVGQIKRIKSAVWWFAVIKQVFGEAGEI